MAGPTNEMKGTTNRPKVTLYPHFHYVQETFDGLFLMGAILIILLTLAPAMISTAETMKVPPPPNILFPGGSPYRVNINHASAADIATSLKGIGKKKAEAIVLYRETYGPFRTIEELQEVKGIGPGTLKKNSHLLYVDDSPGTHYAIKKSD